MRRVLLAAAVAVVVLGLSGCGSPGPATSSGVLPSVPGGVEIPVAGQRAPDPELAAERAALVETVVEPCAEQPWNADGAPWNDSTFAAAGVTPPMILNTGREINQAQQSSGIDPFTDLSRGERAQAIYQILVGPDGSRELIQLAATTGNGAVEAAGRRIASTLRFRPATRFGCGVISWFEFPFRMVRNDDPSAP